MTDYSIDDLALLAHLDMTTSINRSFNWALWALAVDAAKDACYQRAHPAPWEPVGLGAARLYEAVRDLWLWVFKDTMKPSCACDHAWLAHRRDASGAEPCTHWGCGCKDFMPF